MDPIWKRGEPLVGGLVLSLLLVAASGLVVVPSASPAAAATARVAPVSSGVVLAQQDESENQGGEDAPEESGAGEGETEGGAGETGPPWTYQMSRISVVMLLGLVGGIGWVYYKLVVKRRREV